VQESAVGAHDRRRRRREPGEGRDGCGVDVGGAGEADEGDDAEERPELVVGEGRAGE
jgi:hypothetical protein